MKTYAINGKYALNNSSKFHWSLLKTMLNLFSPGKTEKLNI